MVRVLYDIQDEQLVEEVIEPNFLFTNKLGGYFLDYKTTKYRGLFSLEKKKNGWTLIKSVDTIGISHVPTEIINRLWCVEKKYHETTERFFHHKDSLLYEIENYKGTSLLTLDVREVHDFDTQGKKYVITKEGDFIIIKFVKNNDFIRYLAIKANAEYMKVNKWEEQKCSFDNKRNSGPSTWFVYSTLRFNIDGDAKIAMSYSSDKLVAINDANYLFYSHAHLKSQKEGKINSLFKKKKMTKRFRTAYRCSLKSFDDLFVENDTLKGIYAGLPWFFQVWTRDEAISMGALISKKRYRLVKELLLKNSSNILDDGRISNRIPYSKLGSADGVGWVFKRLADTFYLLDSKKAFLEYWEGSEVSQITANLKQAIEKTLKNYVKHGLTINRKKETWMDTDPGNDPRSGARIEIQALTLNMLKLAKDLCKYIDDPDHKRYSMLEKEMRKRIKKHFYKNGVLNDGLDDSTIRPNVFIAYYVYPDLLRIGEWRSVFKNALSSLWLEWGGLSTIDKDHPLYCDEYTGMGDKSYHRGDSWYWLNNLAAICLYRVDKKLFSRHITGILEASTEEILRMGAIGCHCEVSSAKEQRSEGSVSQAWSSAMYIELINELF